MRQKKAKEDFEDFLVNKVRSEKFTFDMSICYHEQIHHGKDDLEILA